MSSSPPASPGPAQPHIQAPAEPEALIEQLGQVIACWHELKPPALAGARPPRHHDAAHHRWLRRALDPATSADAAAEAADRLGRPGRASAWADLLASAAQLAPVLVHGDIHEDQLLAEGGQLTGIIDWETARVDHRSGISGYGGAARSEEHTSELQSLRH